MEEEFDIQLLDEGYDLEFFDCRDDLINEFLKSNAMKFKKALFLQVYVILKDNKVIAYLALTASSVRHGLEEIFSIVPCVLLGKIGVDYRYQGKGLGSFLIHLAIKITKDISEKIGCRLLIVDAFYDQIFWYKKRGFEILEDQKPRKSRGITTQKMKIDII